MRYVTLVVVLWALAFAAQAQTVIRIEAQGSLLTAGESNFSNLGGDDTTEYADVFSYDWSFLAQTDSSSGLATARTSIGPVRFVKSIGASSVQLRQALDRNEVMDAEFRVYAPNTDDGTTELLYRVTGSNGRVFAIRPFFTSGSAPLQALEEVGIAFAVLEFEHVPSGTITTIQQ